MSGQQTDKRVEMFTIGSKIDFHENINKDPFLGNCVVCGRKVGTKPKFIRFNFDGLIDPSKQEFESYKFAVGQECVKKFESECLIND